METRDLTRLECTIGSPVYPSVQGHNDSALRLARSYEDATARRSGCQVIDISLESSQSPVHSIVFKNRYTHSITVKCSHKRHPSGPEDWRVCVSDYPLMPNCHCLQGSQSWVELGEEEGLTGMEGVVNLQLILRQPSAQWREFGIDNFSCYTTKNIDCSLKIKPHSGTNMNQVLGLLGEMLSLIEDSQNTVKGSEHY